jgi:hypothetical protein
MFQHADPEITAIKMIQDPRVHHKNSPGLGLPRTHVTAKIMLPVSWRIEKGIELPDCRHDAAFGMDFIQGQNLKID